MKHKEAFAKLKASTWRYGLLGARKLDWLKQMDVINFGYEKKEVGEKEF
jgi:hypothetical protein